MIDYKKLFYYPILLIGITMILLGCRWLLVDEPWMLDEIANVERLEMTFDELFEADINRTLPGYLKQIYRFFGLWVAIIGLFITFFSTPNLNHSSSIRLRLLLCIGVMILIGAILAYSLIPSSPFIYLIWIMAPLYIISLYGHIINKEKLN